MKKYYRVWFIYFLVAIYSFCIYYSCSNFNGFKFTSIGSILLLYLILDNLFKLANLTIFGHPILNNIESDDDYIEERDIKQSNKILFYKLKKQYLNNVSYEDIEDLIYFLKNELKERNNKK